MIMCQAQQQQPGLTTTVKTNSKQYSQPERESTAACMIMCQVKQQQPGPTTTMKTNSKQYSQVSKCCAEMPS